MINDLEICGKAVNQMLAMAVTFSKPEARTILRSWGKHAALVTHPKGNRRYGSFILRIACNQLQSVFLDDPSQTYCKNCYGIGTEKVYDVAAGNTTIPCQECKSKGVRNERHDAIQVRQSFHRHNRWAV